MKKVIETRGLTKIYPGKKGQNVAALENVELVVDRGEWVVAIFGESGSGKTTLMHILGLLDRPTSGKYFLDGQDTSTFSEGERTLKRGKYIGFVSQQFNLVSHETALENVASPIYEEVGKKKAEERAREALRRVGLKDRAEHLPSELSGGQKQRVAIARALINDPVLLLADEPTSGLDSKSKNTVLRVFEELREKSPKQLTIVVVTHDDAIATWAQRKVEFQGGRIIRDVALTTETGVTAQQPEAGSVRSTREQQQARAIAKAIDHAERALDYFVDIRDYDDAGTISKALVPFNLSAVERALERCENDEEEFSSAYSFAEAVAPYDPYAAERIMKKLEDKEYGWQAKTVATALAPYDPIAVEELMTRMMRKGQIIDLPRIALAFNPPRIDFAEEVLRRLEDAGEIGNVILTAELLAPYKPGTTARIIKKLEDSEDRFREAAKLASATAPHSLPAIERLLKKCDPSMDHWSFTYLAEAIAPHEPAIAEKAMNQMWEELPSYAARIATALAPYNRDAAQRLWQMCKSDYSWNENVVKLSLALEPHNTSFAKDLIKRYVSSEHDGMAVNIARALAPYDPAAVGEAIIWLSDKENYSYAFDLAAYLTRYDPFALTNAMERLEGTGRAWMIAVCLLKGHTRSR